jgi:hypothetical protein
MRRLPSTSVPAVNDDVAVGAEVTLGAGVMVEVRVDDNVGSGVDSAVVEGADEDVDVCRR